MALWVYTDQVPGLHLRAGLLFVADSSLSKKVSRFCQVNSGLNEEKHQHISARTGYKIIVPRICSFLTSLFQLFVHHLGLDLTHNFLQASTIQMRITKEEAGLEIILLIRLTQRLK